MAQDKGSPGGGNGFKLTPQPQFPKCWFPGELIGAPRSLGNAGPVPLWAGGSRHSAHIYLALGALFPRGSVGLCSVEPFWNKDFELDPGGVVGQGRAEDPLMLEPKEVEVAFERLLRGQANPSTIGLRDSKYPLGLKPKTSLLWGHPKPSERTAQPWPQGDLEKKAWPEPRQSLPPGPRGLCARRGRVPAFLVTLNPHSEAGSISEWGRSSDVIGI